MKSKKTLIGLIILAAFVAFLFNACAPLREFGRTPAYQGSNALNYSLPFYDSSKKTVVIVANNDGTELFDMMAPFYLFNATERANVYIVAKNKFPIVIKKGLFVLPQSTLSEIDSLRIRPDVIVIPFLAIADSVNQDPVIVNWIKQHYSPAVTILSVCDGAATAAATGIFDGKAITAHASDYEGIKAHFRKPLWIQNTSVAGSENLYSTAGVSNATEGSLIVINKLFGAEAMKRVIRDVSYPHTAPRTEHQSKVFQVSNKIAVGKKILFRKDKKLGVFLQPGINEFDLAGVMDTYNRTFPASIESFSRENAQIKTKYGLTLLPTGKLRSARLDELHVINFPSFSKYEYQLLNVKDVVQHDRRERRYIIDKCLQRINAEYGKGFENVVKLMLDYN